MADEILVDVGIPTHGRPAYLAEAIAAVEQQSLTAWSLTISENGPESEFVSAIVRSRRSPRIHHVATGVDLGAARNHTEVIRIGSAPYVAILNDDDRWGTTFLERRVAFLQAHPECAFVFSACDFIDQAGRVLFRYDLDLSPGVQDARAFLKTLYARCLVCMPTVLVARWAYEAVGPEFSSSILFYDHEMWLRLAARFPVGVVGGADAQYRVHPSQATQTKARLRVGEHKLDVLDAVGGLLPPEFPSRERHRARFVALTRAGLDAFARRDLAEGLWRFGQAIAAHPLAIVDPEILRRVAARMRQRSRDREFWSVGLPP